MSDYVAKPSANPDIADKPRFLTPTEIATIVNQLPPVRSADELAAKVARDEIIKLYTEEFSRIELAPSQIPAFTKDFVYSYRRSQIQWGTPVGPFVSEGFGATTTQMTLNTFHQSGSAKNVSSGIRALRDLIFARKKRQTPAATIYFKDRHMTFAEALNKRADIVGSVIHDFLLDDGYDIDDPSAFERYYWHDLFSQVTGKAIPKSNQMMRLRFDTTLLYAFRISLADIATVLEREIPPAVICVYGPASSGIIDIYPDETVISVTLQAKEVMIGNMAAKTFLSLIVLPGLDNIRIKGVPEIRHLYPMESPIWRVVVEQIKLTGPALDAYNLGNYGIIITSEERDRVWMIRLSAELMLVTGIDEAGVQLLMQAVGVRILFRSDNPTAIFIIMPANWTASLTGNKSPTPGDYVNNAVLEYGQRVAPKDRKPDTDLVRLSRFAYATADVDFKPNTASNALYDLLAREDVDATRTITDNIHEISQVLGIEAARSFLVHEYNEVIENAEGYISPPAIELMVDFQTSRGVYLGLTYHGVSRQGNGHLTMATNERAAQVLKTASAFGKTEDTSSASAAIAVGNIPKLGSGAVQTILVDETKSNKWLEERRLIDAARLRQIEEQLESGTLNITAVDTDTALGERESKTFSATIFDERGGSDEIDTSDIFGTLESVPNITGQGRILASQVVKAKRPIVVNGVLPSNRTRSSEVVSKQLLDALDTLRLPQPKPVTDVTYTTHTIAGPANLLPTIVPLGTGIPSGLMTLLNQVQLVKTSEQQLIENMQKLTLQPVKSVAAPTSKVSMPPVVAKISLPSVPPVVSKISLPSVPPVVSKISMPPPISMVTQGQSKISMPPPISMVTAQSKISIPPPITQGQSKISLPPPAVTTQPKVSLPPPSEPSTPILGLPALGDITLSSTAQGEQVVQQINTQAFIQAMSKK